MTYGLMKWFLFGVLLSLLPLLFVVLDGVTSGNIPTFVDLCSRGELQLISIGLAASSIGDLMGQQRSKRPDNKGALFVGWVAVLCVALAAGWYATIAAKVNAGLNIDREYIATGSIILFLVTFITSGGCKIVALSEEDGSQGNV